MSIEEKARELADALANSQELQEMRMAEIAMGQDNEAQVIIAEFTEKQKEFYSVQMQGQELSDAQKQEVAAIEEKMQNNATIANYIGKQQKFEKMLQTVNLIIGRAISGDNGCGSDCGSDCGSECGSECGPNCGCM